MPLGPILSAAAPHLISAGVSHFAGRAASKGARRRAAQSNRAIEEEISGLRDISDDFLGMFRDQWDFYKDNFQDVDLAMLEDVMQQREKGPDLGIASADVASAFRKAGDAEGRRQRRFGIDPTSGAAVASRGDLARDQALAEVGARNLERRRHEDENFQRMGQVSALGARHAGRAMQLAGAGANLRSNIINALTGQREQHLTDAQAAASTVGRVTGAIPWGDILDSGSPESTPPPEEAIPTGD